jgi:hypothetical protein
MRGSNDVIVGIILKSIMDGKTPFLYAIYDFRCSCGGDAVGIAYFCANDGFSIK